MAMEKPTRNNVINKRSHTCHSKTLVNEKILLLADWLFISNVMPAKPNVGTVKSMTCARSDVIVKSPNIKSAFFEIKQLISVFFCFQFQF
jgi:hypothetical protein